MLKEAALFAVALLFRASFGFVSPPAYLSPQTCNAWTAKSNINFPEAGPLAVDSSNEIVGDKIKPADTWALPAKRGGPSAKASNETAPKPDERPEASGQAMGGNSACDQETTTAGGAKENIDVDAVESLRVEPLAETVKPSTELEDGTIKIRKKSKGGVVATPETTAAEKVLTLLELGLVDKEEVTAYYDALSELERTTRGAKEATVPTAFKSSLPSNRVQGEGGTVELVLFPAACAILGATGMRSLHLTGDPFTVASTALCTVGAIAGGAVGWVVVARDDVVGGAAKSAGLAVARSASFIGNSAGRSIKEAAAGATSAITSAAVEIIVNAPAKAAGELAKTVSDSASSAVGSVAGLPGKVANNAVEEAKSVLQGTPETVIGLAGDLALQAVDAAGGALLYTSKAAVKAVKESQQGTANQLLQDTSPVAGERQKRSTETVVSVDSDDRVGAASSVEEMASLEALDAKMASVREALERFDAVKNRIETAQTSESLTEVVNMTRRRGATPEPETGEATPTTAPAGNEKGVNPPRLSRVSASSSSFSNRPEVKRIDEGGRKRLAERLLERASQRAAAAKYDLRTSEASARREVENTPTVGGDAREMAAGVAVDVKSP